MNEAHLLIFTPETLPANRFNIRIVGIVEITRNDLVVERKELNTVSR